MSVSLRNGSASKLRLCLTAARRYLSSKQSDIRGLVLGAYTKDKCIELTPTAKQFDEQHSGKLTKNLQLAGELKEGGCRTFWGLDDEYKAVVVVGMGKKDKGFDSLENICDDRECARTTAAVGCQELERFGVYDVCVEDLGNAECAAEGATLAAFKYQAFRTKPKPTVQVGFYNESDASATAEEQWKHGFLTAQGQNVARTLADTPANKLTPSIFGQRAEELLSGKKHVKVEVHDRKWIEAKKMGAFLSVAAGSHEEPKFLEITYNNGAKGEKPLVLVGKGVTFDTGGISIKPSKGMPMMRGDMGGAAAVMGAMHAVSDLELKLNMKCLIPLTDNMPSGSATCPGDVVTAMNGKTIAVDNTDAEGRLILADALCYTACFDPKCVVDLATLTGAIGVALGKGAAGAYSNCHEMYRMLEEAGARTGDRVWRMPLWKYYTKLMTDCGAYDLNNVSEQGGGSCTAAGFLREFVPKGVNWMHIDIASVAMDPQPMCYLKTAMSGRPTRTLIEFIVMNQGKM